MSSAACSALAPALQPPARFGAVMAVSEEARSAAQTPGPASRMGHVPHPYLIGGGGTDRPWPGPAGAAGALRALGLAVLAEDA